MLNPFKNFFFSFQDLNTIHHELGHIQYQQQYKTLPQVTSNFIKIEDFAGRYITSSYVLYYYLPELVMVRCTETEPTTGSTRQLGN